MTALAKQHRPRTHIFYSGLGLSAPSNGDIVAGAAMLARNSHVSQPGQRAVTDLAERQGGSLEERLFDARAACKIEARKFSMLFDNDWHGRLFRQLDLLMDADEWDKCDMPVTRESFATFLRLLMILRNKRRPGLGIAAGGNILATWSKSGRDRLTVECLSSDRVRWIVTNPLGDGSESAVGETELDRLLVNLAPYNPEHWFAHEGPRPAG